ncbi:MAG: hypothetical protein AB7E45_02130 [Candidatus Caldatribacteriota bacterium]
MVYWSSLYDSVYNSIDRPPQWVIDDDDLLDKWLEEQMKELEDRAEKEYRDKRGMAKSARSAWEHEEVVSIDRTLGRYNPRPPQRGQ